MTGSITGNTKKKGDWAGKIVKQLAAISFGALFLWLAFRNADIGKIWGYAKGVEPIYLLLLCVSILASHLTRAYRWVIFLSPLSKEKIRLFSSFSATMFGYAVNLVIPRGGEVVRIISISKSEGLPWAGVLPTMLIDRLLDVAVLCLLFAPENAISANWRYLACYREHSGFNCIAENISPHSLRIVVDFCEKIAARQGIRSFK